MNLHRVTFSLADEKSGIITHHQEFFGSDGAASKRMTEIKKDKKAELDGKVEREPIDIPTGKVDLLAWLNVHATVVSAELAE
jgi:hypothetical protein